MRHIPASAWEASKAWTTLTAIAAFYLGFSHKLADYSFKVFKTEFSLSVFGDISAFWALIPVGLLFLLGLMRAPFEEYQRVQTSKEDLEERLAAYEGQGKPKVVARLENPGPVSIRQRTPEGIDWRGLDLVCAVPYRPYETESAFLHEPAAKFPVEDIDEVFFVIVDYEVKGENAHRPKEDEDLEESIEDIRGRPSIPLPIRLQVAILVVGDDAKVAAELDIHEGDVEELGDGVWQHTVHANGILSGLSEGMYGLNVCDHLDAPLFDPPSNARREYRNMRLRVIRQQ
jgi:hypothetical protein